MKLKKIGLVGLGNLGYAIGRGLGLSGLGPRLVACDRNPAKRDRLHNDSGVRTVEDWREACHNANLILLAVRTGQVVPLLQEATGLMSEGQVLVCLSAGIQESTIAAALPSPGPMPIRVIANVNTASGHGFSMIFQNPKRSLENEHSLVQRVFEEIGEVLVVPSERELDRMSVLPGCAPAAFSVFAEGLVEFGKEAGFDSKRAMYVVQQTLQATLLTMDDLQETPVNYKSRVAAPGGVVDKVLSGKESELLKNAASAWHRFILKKLDRE